MKLQFHLTTFKAADVIECGKLVYVIVDNPTDEKIEDLVKAWGLIFAESIF